MAADGLDLDWYVLPAPHRGRGAAVGPPLGRACTRTSSGRTGGTRSTRSASRTAAGRPATTAAPAPATASSTSWPRPCRRPAAARARARTSSRRSAGARSLAVDGAEPGAAVRRGVRQRVRFRFTKLGKVRFTSHRDVARVWERRCVGPAAASPTPRASRPGPSCSFGLALSTGLRVLGEYLDVDLVDDARPRRARRASAHPSAARAASRRQAAIRSPPGTDSLQQAVTSCVVARSRSVRRRPRATLGAAVAAALAARRAPDDPSAQGHRPTSTTSARRILARRRTAATAPRSSPSWPPNPAASARPSCSPPSTRRVEPPSAHGCCRTHQWTSVDGARCEPIPSGTSAHATRRRPRTRKRVRHEKGTHP